MPMYNPELYPFTIHNVQHTRAFQKWRKDNLAAITEKYGHWRYTGVHERIWSYYEVDARIEGPDRVTFVSYGMQSSVTGGRGLEQERIESESGSVDLTRWIRQGQYNFTIARWAWNKQEAKRKRNRLEQEALHKELFGLSMLTEDEYFERTWQTGEPDDNRK